MSYVISFWLLCAFVTAAIAAERGRSFFGWLLIGLLFGILGVTMAAAFSRVDRASEKVPDFGVAIPNDLEYVCQSCGKLTYRDRIMCVHCGKRP